MARPDACYVFLTDGSAARVQDLAGALRSLERHANSVATWPTRGYPVLIFYDSSDSALPLSPAARALLASSAPSGISFVPVNLTELVPAAVLAAAPAELVVEGTSFSLGYRLMCNFFAGPIAQQPALAPFRYFLRFDADARLLDDVRDDVFVTMQREGWRYAYAVEQCDWHAVTRGLDAAAAAAFGGPAALRARLEPRFTDTSCRADAPGDVWNTRIFYNNLEAVDLEFLRSPSYQRWYAALSEDGGILTRRWGDAPIRTLAVKALLPADAVGRLSDISYYHQSYFLGRTLLLRLVASGALLLVLAAAAIVALLRRWRGVGCAAPRSGERRRGGAACGAALGCPCCARSAAGGVVEEDE